MWELGKIIFSIFIHSKMRKTLILVTIQGFGLFFSTFTWSWKGWVDYLKVCFLFFWVFFLFYHHLLAIAVVKKSCVLDLSLFQHVHDLEIPQLCCALMIAGAWDVPLIITMCTLGHPTWELKSLQLTDSVNLVIQLIMNILTHSRSQFQECPPDNFQQFQQPPREKIWLSNAGKQRAGVIKIRHKHAQKNITIPIFPYLWLPLHGQRLLI